MQLARIVVVEAKVMYGIAVNGIQLHLFPVQEGRFGSHGAGCHDMTVGQDQPTLRVYDESCCLCRCVPFRVECTGRIDIDGDDAARNPLERGRPVGVLLYGHGLLSDLRRLLRAAGRGGSWRLHREQLRRTLLGGYLLGGRLAGRWRGVRSGRRISC